VTAFAATKLKAESIEVVRPEFREDLPKRGLLFLVGNQYSTGRRVAVDVDRGSMQFRQRSGYSPGNADGPRRAGPQNFLMPSWRIDRTGQCLWSSDPQFAEARRSKPDQGVTLFLIDGNQVKQFNSHDPADEIHMMYETLWKWAARFIPNLPPFEPPREAEDAGERGKWFECLFHWQFRPDS